MSGDAIDIGGVGPDEMPVWADLDNRGFYDRRRPSETRVGFLRQQLGRHRFRLARIDGVPCGTYRSWDLDLPVPGRGTVLTRAIGSLSVLSSYRRRGVARAFVEEALADGREAGTALSLLIASQTALYGRYGFGAATQTVHLTVDTRRVEYVPSGIHFEATEDAVLREHAPALYAAVAAGQPGALPRPDLWWDRACGLFVEPADAELYRPAVIARDDAGTVVGTASYRIQGDWELDSQAGIQLLDLTAATPEAYRALWGYLAELDLTDRIVAADRPIHEPLVWMLTDRRAVTQAHRTDFQWVRVLDVPAALGARRAQGAGRVVLEVVDPAGFAGGRWLLDADEDGRFEVSATGVAAEVTVPVQTLGAIYLGQNPLTELQQAGLADEHRAGAVRTLDRLLGWAPEGTVGHTWF
jgi:predicted acetyltransferase